MGGGTHDGTDWVKPWVNTTQYPNRPRGPQAAFYEPAKTLRDEFAMAALVIVDVRNWSPEILAKQTYAIADAMMKERVK